MSIPPPNRVGFVAFVSLILGTLGLLPFASQIYDSQTSAKIDLRWFHWDGANIVVEPDSEAPALDLADDDLWTRRVRMPLNLAVRNRERGRLHLLRLVISYPPAIDVRSTAGRSIDSRNIEVAYAHDLGVIEPGPMFQPLREVDTLSVSVDHLLQAAMIMKSDSIPYYIEMLTPKAMADRDSGNVLFDFRIMAYTDEHKPTEFGYFIRGQVTERSWWPPMIGTIEVQPSARDRMLFGSITSSTYDSLESWRFPDKRGKYFVDYAKVWSGRERYQLYSVNNVLRRLVIDSNNDGFVDFELRRPERRPTKIIRVNYDKPRRLDRPPAYKRIM